MAIVNPKHSTIRDFVTGPFMAALIGENNFDVASHDHQAFLGVFDHAAIVDCHRGIVGGFNRRFFRVLSGTAYMERPHGQLSSRLTDGLGGNHANRLADVYRCAPG